MYRKIQNEYQQDPYQTIRKLRTLMQEQKRQLQEYQMVCDSVVAEKNTAVSEMSQMKKQVEYLTQRLQQQKTNKSSVSLSSTNIFATKTFSKQNRQNLITMSPQICKSDITSSHIIVVSSPIDNAAKKQPKTKEFIPSEIVFVSKPKKIIKASHNSICESSSQNLIQNVGEFLIEDVIIISPDTIQLKRAKQEQKEEKILTISEYYYFNYNSTYKNKKPEYLKDIAKRSFPHGAQVKRKNIQNYQEFKNQIQFKTEGKMGQQYFILNLKGDFNDHPTQKELLGNCNPYGALFAVCLKVPDFIPIKDEKSNQKQEQHVWMVEKVYAILTYYPFFHVHLSILARMHKLLEPRWNKLQREQILTQNLQRNISETQKNQQINHLISYFMSKKPDYNQICVHDNNYFGTLPNFGVPTEYAIARFACPIFFSIFAYEEMLLLLMAIFLQKSIIFVSKSESAATLCALFLTTIIAPFRYNQQLILNCDKQKIQNIVFQYPFILVATIKKPQVYSNILKSFIDNNSDRFKGFTGKDQTGPLMLVDIDSNSIFFDSLLNKTFEELIVSPSDQLRQAYLLVNQSVSKSFTFPKKMPVEVYAMPKNDYQKNEEIRRKVQKQYQQKIQNNTSKWPTYSPNESHFIVLKLLTDYIQSFSINSDYQFQLIKNTIGNPQARKKAACKHLLQKNPCHQKFVGIIVESQLFADYLDNLQKKIGSIS